jgi:predicted Zn-dependent peptidase
MVRLPALRPDDLESLKAARGSRAERELASPTSVGRLVYRGALLGEDHPLARGLDGTPESLASVSHADLKTFAREYLDPAGLILSFVGPEDPEDVFGAVEERFASARTGGGSWEVASWPVTGEPGPTVERELGGKQWRVYLGRIAPQGSDDQAALHLLAGLLSDRLAMTLREKEGLSYSLGASVVFQGEPDLAWLTVQIGTRPGNREAVLSGVRREMDRLRAEMADAQEIGRVRATLRSRALMRRLTTINRARFLGVRAFTGVANHEDLDALDRLDTVTRDHLEGLATQWLDDGQYRVVVIQ